jgi:hypothetical protein
MRLRMSGRAQVRAVNVKSPFDDVSHRTGFLFLRPAAFGSRHTRVNAGEGG